MSGGIDMRIDNPKLKILVMAILVSVGLSQPVLGIKLDNHTQDNIKVFIRSYDKNNKQKIQNIAIKANSTAQVNIENCPTYQHNQSPSPSNIHCEIVLNSAQAPHRKGEHIISNNTEKDETFKITIPSSTKYDLEAE